MPAACMKTHHQTAGPQEVKAPAIAVGNPVGTTTSDMREKTLFTRFSRTQAGSQDLFLSTPFLIDKPRRCEL